MTKIMSGFLTLCLVAALGAGAQARDNDKMHGMHGGMGMMGKHHCAPGQHWVKGYKNKWGKHVKGYCR
jgi:hypothetical protein